MAATVAYEAAPKLGFFFDVIALQSAARKNAVRAVAALQQDPFGPKSKRILKSDYKNLYRYRLGDYRLIYSVGTHCIAPLAVGHRKDIYDRFKKADTAAPAAAVDLASAGPVAVPTVPEDASIADGPDGADDGARDTASDGVVEPPPILAELLDIWGVSKEHRDLILACKNTDELLDAGLPDPVLAKVLHVQSPPKIDQVIEQPSYEMPTEETLQQCLEGTLSGFLLRLDPAQRKLASAQRSGPTLVKGGAGTGKSLVALYRIRALLAPEGQQSLFGGNPPRVLLVTFTRALTRASEQLLSALVGPAGMEHVHVSTLDQIAHDLCTKAGVTRSRALADGQRKALSSARSTMAFPGGPLDQLALQKACETLQPSYLLEEFDWVLDGRDIATLDAYLQAPRPGRGTALRARARKAVWWLHQAWSNALESDDTLTFTQAQRRALKLAASLDDAERYDVVVIDEAQDLKPVGLQLAISLCRSPQGLYLTADEKQTIYGRSYSWSQVSDALQLKGHTHVLRRNYRSNRAIQQAASDVLRRCGISEAEDSAEAVREGPAPLCVAHEDGSAGSVIAEQIRAWAAELRLPTWTAAVLVRRRQAGGRIAAELQAAGMAAEWVEGNALELDSHFVKVMTIHSAKGLEFPMVVVPGIEQGVLPASATCQDADDATEHERQEARLLHVALTRAMRRLMVLYPVRRPSPYVDHFQAPLWQRLEK